MSITYGLTPTGFVPKTIAVVRADLSAALQAAFGASIDLGDKSIFGQIVGILAERIASLWSQLEAVNSSADPDKALDAALDALCAITGTLRPLASYSLVTETLFGTPATVVPVNTVINAASTGAGFTTKASATIAAVAAWTATHAYVVGDRVWNDTTRVYQCITAGTSAGAGGPTGTAADITDGTVHWKHIQSGVADHGAVDVAMRATVTGAVTAVAGDITSIVNPIIGLVSATNLADAAPGRDLATNSELAQLRDLELSGAGKSPIDAIRAALLKITNVISVTVFANETDFTNSDGMPPHSVEALIRPTWSPGDPLDQQFYDTLLASVAAGIVTYGNQTGSSTDTQGTAHVMKYSRPTSFSIYARLSVQYDSTQYPTDGDAQIKAAISTFGTKLATGRDVDPSAVGAQAFSIGGVLGVPEVLVYTDAIAAPAAWAPTTAYVATVGARSVVTNDGRTYICVTSGTSAGSGGPLGAGTDITDGTAHWYFLGNKIAITSRQLAVFDTTRTAVVSAAVTP